MTPAQFIDILEELNSRLTELNAERQSEELPLLNPIKIKILGQFSLLINPAIEGKLHPTATVDVDALLSCEWICKVEFKRLLQEHGYAYDELSNEIWIPQDAQFVEIFRSRFVWCDSLSPLDALVSKAIKAPEKNKVHSGPERLAILVNMLLRNSQLLLGHIDSRD